MTRSTTKSFMKTCVFTPTHETGILMADIIPYAGNHDTRLGRESSWPLVPAGTHVFFRPLGVKGFFCARTGRAAFLFRRNPMECGFFHIPPNLVVRRCRRTLIASGSEDLQVEHPVCGGQSPAFHFHPTLARVQGSALVRDQVVQVRQAGEKRCLTPTEMMEALHHEQLPLEGVVGLV